MKQTEKSAISRRKIMDSALAEFAGRGYGLSSINTICEAGGISKGNLYHYFKGKDELYLSCIRETFQALRDYLEGHAGAGTGIQRLKAYYQARTDFFAANPNYQRLFQAAMISPPAALASEIQEMFADFNRQTLSTLDDVLEGMDLRPGVTSDEVLALFGLYQEFVNTRAPQDRETYSRHMLDLLLYGVARP